MDLTRSSSRGEVLDAFHAAPRIAIIRTSDGVAALNSTVELMGDLGRPRSDMWEVALWEDVLTVSGNEPLRGGAGINVPQSALSIPSVSERDLAYLDFGLAHGVDWVAVSFVRSANDLEVIRARCKAAQRMPGLIAKIER